MNKLSTDLSLDCKTDIIVEYSITNIGKVEETVDNIKAAFNGERPFESVVDDLPLPARTLLPGQTVTSSKTYPLDFCSTYQASLETSLLFEIEVDCVSGETHIAAFNYSFERFPSPECLVELDISCKTLDGGPCLGKPASQGLCTFRPFYFDFFLNGGTCAESVNEQDPSRFSCRDHQDISTFSQVYVVVKGVKKRKHYFSGMVSRNERFTIGYGNRIDSDLRVSIYSHPGGILMQKLQFHSSCSKGLSIGDTFGAVTIAGFRDKSHDVVMGNVAPRTTDYNIYYTISNIGHHDIQLENLLFTAEDNRTIAAVISDGKTMTSGGMMSGKVTVFNMTAHDFETSATLNYRTLPLFASKNCVAVDHFEASGCSDKGTNSKGSKGSNKCSGKGSKSSKKGGGKGSISSKSSKSAYRSKGKAGASISHSTSRKSGKSPSSSKKGSSKGSSDSGSNKGSSISHSTSRKSGKSPSASKKGSSKGTSDSGSNKGSSISHSTSRKSGKSPSASKKGSSKGSSDSGSKKGSSISHSTSRKSGKSRKSSIRSGKGFTKLASKGESKDSSHSKFKSSKSWKSPSSSRIVPSKLSSSSGIQVHISKFKSSKAKSGKSSDSSKKDSAYRKGKGKKKNRTRNMK
jgi:hypothetical protein